MSELRSSSGLNSAPSGRGGTALYSFAPLFVGTWTVSALGAAMNNAPVDKRSHRRTVSVLPTVGHSGWDCWVAQRLRVSLTFRGTAGQLPAVAAACHSPPGHARGRPGPLRTVTACHPGPTPCVCACVRMGGRAVIPCSAPPPFRL